jgi:integrase
MARARSKLTALQAKTKKPGRYGDGAGLYLVVAETGARKWVFRFSLNGKVTEMGLGSADAVALADARDRTDEARRCVARGQNPIEQRKEAAKAAAGKPTFGQMADELIESKESGWRNAKHRQQWRNTLKTDAGLLREKPVDTIVTSDILAVLKPIWQSKPETASRLRGRIEAVLDAARANGHIPENTANPARWRGHLDKLLAKPKKLTRGHHPALPFGEAPAFLKRLRERRGVAALLLEFIILTAARTGEARGANWSEFDLRAKVWTVPASRMKGNREHRVPLCERAVEIVKDLAKVKVSDFVFPGNKPGKPLSNMAPDMLLRRMKVDEFTTHGFRSSFRDWAGECTAFPSEVAEAALAHLVGDETERAYRRADALAKRRKLMDAWASYLNRPRAAGDNVRPFEKAKA